MGTSVPTHPTKALARFLTLLQSRPQPVLVDLGPVVGSNVTFFGEQLGCKIFVENLYKDLDSHAGSGDVDVLASFLEKRLTHADETVDGILCWDLFDYLDRKAALALAARLTRLLKPEGVLLALFAANEPQASDASGYTRFVVVDPATLEYRPCDGAQRRGRAVPNRDVQRMFEPLRIAEQFLLKNRVREVLFRKAPTSTQG